MTSIGGIQIAAPKIFETTGLEVWLLNPEFPE